MIVLWIVARILLGLIIAEILLVLCMFAKVIARIAWISIKHVFSSRGEEAGTPELTCGCPADGRPVYSCLYCDNSRCAAHRDQHKHSDDEMAVANATSASDFAVWESECSKLQRLADKLGTRS